MRVLVTGASGFVGSTLCDELAKRGIETKVLMRKSQGNFRQNNMQAVHGDLRDPDSLTTAVSDVDTILHVAGVVAAKSRNDFFAANALGTKNLLEAANRHGRNVKKFVYVSSLAAAGPSSAGSPRVENQADTPVSIYGESKLAGEREVLQKHNFSKVIIRPPAVYGPRDKGILTFFQIVHRGILPILGTESPDPRRYSFVHVDDLIQGILLSAEKDMEQELFYISGDEIFSWEDAMRLIAKALGKNTWDIRLPIPLLTSAAAICSGITKITGNVLPFSLDKIKEIKAPAWTCSNQKAKKILEFKPYWTLERGFEQTAHWYRENGWL